LKVSRFCAVLLSTLVASALSHAQTYPTKPVRFLVGFPPSGTNDIVARLVAQKVSELIGQSVVVENRGGANTAIATELGARAHADGYTILLNAPGHATNPALMKLNFDPVKPRAIIDRLNSEFVRAIKTPDLRDKLVTAGADPAGTTPEQYTAFVQQEIAKWDKVIKAAGIKGE
jgi:tripartite-type tricarboxylate transporter receptor subunit TctC